MTRGSNIGAFGRGVEAAAAAFMTAVPQGVSLDRIADQPAVVEEALGEFERSFLEALVIVLAVSFLSLGWRAGVVVLLSVPLVLAITFVVMAVLGIDLHRITLGALIIALGLLVDDAIIAVEMMSVKIEQGFERARAAAFAWDSTALPMLTGTLVTVVGFLPVGFARSAVGEYAGGIFSVVAIALIASWFVAVVFTPYLGVLLLPAKGAGRDGAGVGGDAHADPGTLPEGRAYRALRRVVAACARRRVLTVLVTLGVVGAAVAGFARVPQQFFPLSERPELFLQLRLPQGSAIGATLEAVREAEALLARGRGGHADPDVATFTAHVGQGSPRFWLGLNPELPNEAFAEIVIVARGGRGARAREGPRRAGGRRRRPRGRPRAGGSLHVQPAGGLPRAVPRDRP